MGRRNGDAPDLFEYAARKQAAETGAPSQRTPPAAATPPAEPEPAAQAPAEPPPGPAPAPEPGTRELPLTVSDLVRRAGHAVERALGTVWVEGEIASLSRPASGHHYFVLCDERAEVKAVMWRSDVRRLKFKVTTGMAVRCRVRPSIYEQGGAFQLYVSAIEPAGLGADALALEQLKARLAGEGLFATARKRKLPHLPRRIGVVTSKSGAAVRDVIRAVQRRFPVPILVADAVVQGEGAPASMIRALHAIARTDVDVVIIGRGGGSSSDLSAFNDEALVRAVAACPVPIISAVGHEVDVSLTDLAADVRAATPTMAGEMAVPVLAELADVLAKEERRLRREIDVAIASERQRIDSELGRANANVARRIARGRHELHEHQRQLETQHPRARLVAHRNDLVHLEERARTAMRRHLDQRGRALAEQAGRLSALSPLRVLQRGYALATSEGAVLTRATQIAPGDRVHLRLAHGAVECVAESIDDDE